MEIRHLDFSQNQHRLRKVNVSLEMLTEPTQGYSFSGLMILLQVYVDVARFWLAEKYACKISEEIFAESDSRHEILPNCFQLNGVIVIGIVSYVNRKKGL